MKRETEGKLKFKHLQRLLDLPLWQARGLLDTLWNFTACNCPKGDIGRFSDDDIAVGIDWRGDPHELVAALVKARWIDESKEHRLVIHDWSEHCEASVHNHLARRGEFFCDGAKPKLSRLSAAERELVERTYSQGARRTHGERTANALSTPLPEPEPLPAPAPEPEPARTLGPLRDIDDATLRDTPKLIAWHAKASAGESPVMPPGERGQLLAVAAAERAIEHGKKPAAFFVDLVKRQQWGWLTQAQEERARQRIAALSRDGPRRKTPGEPRSAADIARALTATP